MKMTDHTQDIQSNGTCNLDKTIKSSSTEGALLKRRNQTLLQLDIKRCQICAPLKLVASKWIYYLQVQELAL